MNATSELAGLPRPRRSTLVWGLALVNVEALFVVTYTAVTSWSLLDPFLVYPFVWINVGLWAILRTQPPDASTRQRRIAALLAVAYFLLLALTSNMLSIDPAGTSPSFGVDLTLYEAPPGWTPSLSYIGSYLTVSLRPPFVVGFAALAYLVYATILDAAGLASAGLLGLLSCVTCTLPLVAAVLTGIAGGAAAPVLSALVPLAYPLGTAVFVVTVALLSWRPSVRPPG